MPWIRLDDQFPDHPKVIEAGPLASWLYVCGIGYCNRLLTDGFIPSGQVRKLADVDSAGELAARLVAVGLWDEAEGGYRVTDAIRWEGQPDSATQDERNSAAYRNWRHAVLARDGHTCQDCGYQDVRLHVHHLYPFAEYPELRTDIDNGISLCVECHGARHGRRLR